MSAREKSGPMCSSGIGPSRNARPRSTEVYDATRVDYGAMMTEDEKRRVRERAGKDEINDWGYYLTSDEKRRILDRADQAIGL